MSGRTDLRSADRRKDGGRADGRWEGRRDGRTDRWTRDGRTDRLKSDGLAIGRSMGPNERTVKLLKEVEVNRAEEKDKRTNGQEDN